MRTALSWILGIAAFFALYTAVGFLANAIGVPVKILFDEPMIVENRYYEEEVDGAFTTFGVCAVIVCIMLASRVGMAVYVGAWRGNVSDRDELTFLAWLFGLSIFGMFGAILFLASRGLPDGMNGAVHNILEFGGAAGIAWAMKTWYDIRVARLAGGRTDRD